MALPLTFYVIVFTMGFLLSTPLLLLTIVLYGPHAKPLGRKLFSLGLTSVWRPIISVNDEGDIALKKRLFNAGRDVAQVKIGKQLKDVLDPQDRLHYFYGTPFGLFDERFGALFDPRDADAGERHGEHFENGTFHYEHEIPENTRIVDFMRAFYELPAGIRSATLSEIRWLIGGGTDAHAAERIIEHYKTSQSPKNSTTGMRQFIVVVGTFLGTLGFWWLIGTQTSGGGGGNPVREISFGVLWLLLSAPSVRGLGGRVKRGLVGIYTKDPPEDKDDSDSSDGNSGLLPPVRAILATILLLGMGSGLVYISSWYFPTNTLIFLWGLFVAGLVFLPGVAVLNRGLPLVGGMLGKLYVILGLLPFDRPVIHLTKLNEYVLRDAKTNENFDISSITWYRFALSWVGFTYDNRPDAWPGRNTAVDPETSEWPDSGTPAALPDGGTQVLPSKYAPTSQLAYGGRTGFIPRDPDTEDTVFVQSHHVLSWFLNVGQSDNLMTAYHYAKEHFGHGTEPLSERYLIFVMCLMMAFATGVGVWIFV